MLERLVNALPRVFDDFGTTLVGSPSRRQQTVATVSSARTRYSEFRPDRGVDAIRAQLSSPRDGFAVVLIGKDGGEKSRVDGPPELDDMFRLIDSMPMRKSEMVRHASLCRSA